MDSNEKIEEMDLYAELDVDISSSTNEIKKAYRKKALQCHPDKNPDDPLAARKFHLLSKILEVLTDEAARSAYDRVLKARKEAQLRHKELDSKRRKLKEDLEIRERLGATGKSAAQTLKEEIERLRKEGSKAVQEEIEIVKRKLAEDKNNAYVRDGSNYRIKIKWVVDKGDPENGGYSQEMLHQFLSKYGDIQALVMSPKKKGSALVEFTDTRAAVSYEQFKHLTFTSNIDKPISIEMAIDLEVGLPTNPLKLEWISGAPKNTKTKGTLLKDSDFESVTLTKLRQAEERKRLIAQMMAEDENN